MRKHLALLLLLLLAGPRAHALLINGNGLYTTGLESVSVTFVNFEASHTDLLFQSSPTLQYLFTNQTAVAGTVYDLGIFGNNTEMIFRLDDLTTDNSYYSGDAARNDDHALHTHFTDLGNNVFRMGFEDLWNGGDRDYNDLIVNITGTPVKLVQDQPPVPEPATLGLIGLGVSSAGFLKRRRRA